MTSISLTHWGRVTHFCVCKLTSIASDNGLAPGWRQAIIWTNAGILLIGPLGTNFNEILSEIHTFSFKKMCLKMSSGKCRPFCLGLNVLTRYSVTHFEDHFWIACLSYFLDPICVVSRTFTGSSDPKLQWSIGRTNWFILFPQSRSV